MEKIDRNNYERFLIDYLEGVLNPEQEQELRSFLDTHPDLKEEFSLVQSHTPISLPQVSELPDFSSLRKPESTEVVDEELIAALEGDLDETAYREFARKLEIYPNLKREFELYQFTKLKPEPLAFSGKAALKKSTARILPMIRTYSAIAAALLILGIGGGLMLLIKQKKKTEIASTEIPLGTPEVSRELKGEQNPVSEKTIPVTEGKRNRELEIISPVTPDPSLSQQLVWIQPKALRDELPITIADALPHQRNAQVWKKGNSEISSPAFLTPSEWLLEQVKQRTPEFITALSDSVSRGGQPIAPASLALAMVEKTTGIRYSRHNEETTGVGGFSLVSKYFAFERITHP